MVLSGAANDGQAMPADITPAIASLATLFIAIPTSSPSTDNPCRTAEMDGKANIGNDNISR
jgi:hypothetical protein